MINYLRRGICRQGIIRGARGLWREGMSGGCVGEGSCARRNDV